MTEEPKPQINKKGLRNIILAAVGTGVLVYGGMRLSDDKPKINTIQQQTVTQYMISEDPAINAEYKIINQEGDDYLLHDGKSYKLVETRKGIGINNSTYSANIAVAMAKQETVTTITNNLEGKINNLRSNLDSMTADVEETVSNLADDRNFLERVRDYIMNNLNKGKEKLQEYKK